MDSAHRKIELQSPEDLTFLINNVRRAAKEHVTAAFPPVEGQDGAEEDELRVRIEKLVEDVRSPPSLSPALPPLPYFLPSLPSALLNPKRSSTQRENPDRKTRAKRTDLTTRPCTLPPPPGHAG